MKGWVIFLLAAWMGPVGVAEEVEALLVRATRYGNTEERREEKAVARAEIRDRMPELFGEILGRIHIPNIGLQVLALELVMEADPDAVFPVLAEAARGEREETRRLATFMLSLLPARDEVDVLMERLEDEATRGGAIRALGQWRVESAAPDLIPYLSSTNERIRIVTANALRTLGATTAAPALVDALDDPYATVRNAAAWALVGSGEAVLPALEEGLERATSARQQRQILRILYEMNSEAATAALSKEWADLAPSAVHDLMWLRGLRAGTGKQDGMGIDGPLFGERGED
ncbi:MAG TPA: HEAT repeat domain-containing protein [Kiritimatiellia bacterium]|nr:HEAT repeat domain-containing protein [Kiritimatiellia bacterium]